MKSIARIGKHPIHPMLIALPLGLWSFSLVADVLYLMNIHELWRYVAAFCLGGGIAGALIAAVPGFMDYLGIKEKSARTIATWHMAINLFLVGLYSANLIVRLNQDFLPQGAPIVLSVIGMVLLGLSGWLGGDLVYVHKVGVVEEITPLEAEQLQSTR